MPPVFGDCALDDKTLRAYLDRLIKHFGVETVVETGINAGGSTCWFTKLCARTIGIDNDHECVEHVRGVLSQTGAQGWEIIEGNSPEVIRDMIRTNHIDAGKTLFFLDAHWQSYWPLRDEIRAMSPGKGIIVIHDAVVPNSDLGHDVCAGQAITYDYLRDAFLHWSADHVIGYNCEWTAQFPYRGILSAFPSIDWKP